MQERHKDAHLEHIHKLPIESLFEYTAEVVIAVKDFELMLVY